MVVSWSYEVGGGHLEVFIQSDTLGKIHVVYPLEPKFLVMFYRRRGTKDTGNITFLLTEGSKVMPRLLTWTRKRINSSISP